MSAPGANAPNLMFSHMGLSVKDVPRMERFYTQVLGFTVTDRGNAGGMDLVRTIFTARPGHATWSVLERVAAFQALVDRLDQGRWGTATDLPDLKAGAGRLTAGAQGDLGGELFVDLHPAAALRTWDASNWGSYRPPAR